MNSQRRLDGAVTSNDIIGGDQDEHSELHKHPQNGRCKGIPRVGEHSLNTWVELQLHSVSGFGLPISQDS